MEYTSERKDIAIVLINQHIAEKIRPLVDRYTQAFPALLEIPSKDHPYDPSKDSVLKRVQKVSSSSILLDRSNPTLTVIFSWCSFSENKGEPPLMSMDDALSSPALSPVNVYFYIHQSHSTSTI